MVIGEIKKKMESANFFKLKLLGHLRVVKTIFNLSSRVLHFKFNIDKHQTHLVLLMKFFTCRPSREKYSQAFLSVMLKIPYTLNSG